MDAAAAASLKHPCKLACGGGVTAENGKSWRKEHTAAFCGRRKGNGRSYLPFPFFAGNCVKQLFRRMFPAESQPQDPCPGNDSRKKKHHCIAAVACFRALACFAGRVVSGGT